MKTFLLAVMSMLLAMAGVVRADAPATQPSKLAAERAESLKASIKDFTLRLGFCGANNRKPYYSLFLSVPPFPEPRKERLSRLDVRVTEEQAKKIIDYMMTTEGFLDREQPFDGDPSPCYLFFLPGIDLDDSLGWGLPMLQRLDGLRTVLDGEAGKQMDLLLGRLAGDRKKWEAAASQPATQPAAAFDIRCNKKNDAVAVTTDADRNILTITSPSGIGGATIKLKSYSWPKQVVMRVHLRGLESLSITCGNQKLSASVASHGVNANSLVLWEDGKDGPALTKNSPYWMEIVALDAEGKPVKGLPDVGGYFEMVIPKALFEEDASKLTIGWIDFYR